MGLAEQSPHLPLKVLHKLLEEPEVAVVGISKYSSHLELYNVISWELDLAKMNRAVTLTRPEPSVEDLRATAMGIVSSQHMMASLHALAESYYQVYRKQSKRDFFGLRDFYSLIKFLHRNIDQSLTSGKTT